MNDKVEEKRKALVEKVIEKMQEGGTNWKKLWNTSIVRPQNPVSGSKYNGINRATLNMVATEREYKDPRWVTFIQAQKEGWKFKENSKGTGVHCEKWHYTKDTKKKDENGIEIQIKEKLKRPYATSFVVFNAEHFENIPKLEIDKELIPIKDKTYGIIEALIESSECPVKELGQERAFYRPEDDFIGLPLKEAFYGNDSAISTLLHEMVHSTGHKDRLARFSEFDNEIKSDRREYAREELIAELGAMFLEQDLQLDLKENSLENHSAYLSSWLKQLKNDPNELFKAIVEAEKASQRILDNLEKYREKEMESLKEKLILADKTKLAMPELSKLGLRIDYCEFDNTLNDKIFRNEKAYEIYEKLMNKDREHNLIRDYKEDTQMYYKTKMTFVYGDYNYNMRVDIGDLEFGGKTKVSEALEYRIQSYFDSLKDEMWYIPEGVTAEEWKLTLKDQEEEFKKVFEHFKEKEQEYLIKNNKISLDMELEPIKSLDDLNLLLQKDKNVEDYHDNGKLKLLGKLVNGEREGIWKEYYENGNMKSKEKYKSGIIQSKEEWYEDMAKKCEMFYKNGNFHGVQKEFYKNGAVKLLAQFTEGKRDGEILIYSEDKKLLKKEFYKNDELQKHPKKIIDRPGREERGRIERGR